MVTPATIRSFRETLLKESRIIPKGFPRDIMSRISRVAGRAGEGIVGDPYKIVRRMHPIRGPKEGWREMTFRDSKLNMLAGLTKPEQEAFRKARNQTLAKARRSQQARVGLKDPDVGVLTRLKRYAATSAGPGEHMLKFKKDPVGLGQIATGKFTGKSAPHLAKELEGKNRFQMLAEELSRRGWTGEGRATKYLPVGQKGIAGGFTATAVPQVINAPEPTRTGGDSTLERGLGELGSAGGFVAGAGLGFVPALGLWWGADKVGRGAGRILDRMRAGAGVQEAVEAPTSEEAGEQIRKIVKYHGGGSE